MTIGAATSHAGAVAVAQQVQGAACIYDAKTERSFWLDWQDFDQILATPNLKIGLEVQAKMKSAVRHLGMEFKGGEDHKFSPHGVNRFTPSSGATRLLAALLPYFL